MSPPYRSSCGDICDLCLIGLRYDSYVQQQNTGRTSTSLIAVEWLYLVHRGVSLWAGASQRNVRCFWALFKGPLHAGSKHAPIWSLEAQDRMLVRVILGRSWASHPGVPLLAPSSICSQADGLNRWLVLEEHAMHCNTRS